MRSILRSEPIKARRLPDATRTPAKEADELSPSGLRASQCSKHGQRVSSRGGGSETRCRRRPFTGNRTETPRQSTKLPDFRLPLGCIRLMEWPQLDLVCSGGHVCTLLCHQPRGQIRLTQMVGAPSVLRKPDSGGKTKGGRFFRLSRTDPPVAPLTCFHVSQQPCCRPGNALVTAGHRLLESRFVLCPPPHELMIIYIFRLFTHKGVYSFGQMGKTKFYALCTFSMHRANDRGLIIARGN